MNLSVKVEFLIKYTEIAATVKTRLDSLRCHSKVVARAHARTGRGAIATLITSPRGSKTRQRGRWGEGEKEEKRCEYLQAVNKQLNELHGHKPNASARAS